MPHPVFLNLSTMTVWTRKFVAVGDRPEWCRKFSSSHAVLSHAPPYRKCVQTLPNVLGNQNPWIENSWSSLIRKQQVVAVKALASMSGISGSDSSFTILATSASLSEIGAHCHACLIGVRHGGRVCTGHGWLMGSESS